MEKICKRIIELRKECGYSQQKVADFLQVNQSDYSKYERGKLEFSVPMVIALCKLYKVSADYILCLVDY